MFCETKTVTRVIDDDFCFSPNSKVYLKKGFIETVLRCLWKAIPQQIPLTG